MIAAENLGSYPPAFIALISIVPSPTASEIAEPVMPEKSMLAATFT